MASRFWVGGTGTWDASTTTHWSATTGGAGGQSVPGSSDTVTLDGASGGGTITAATDFTVTSLTMGTFTGTLDFSANNNNPTIGAFSGTGSGIRTLNLGSGTFTINGVNGGWDQGVVTNLTFNAGTSTILISNVPTSTRVLSLGSKTYNNVSVVNAAMQPFLVDMANGASPTIANLTLTNVQQVRLPAAALVTVSGALTWDGSSTNQGNLFTSGAVATLSVANATILSWLLVQQITKAGAGTITVNSGFDGGGNTGVTIHLPSGSHFLGG